MTASKRTSAGCAIVTWIVERFDESGHCIAKARVAASSWHEARQKAQAALRADADDKRLRATRA